MHPALLAWIPTPRPPATAANASAAPAAPPPPAAPPAAPAPTPESPSDAFVRDGSARMERRWRADWEPVRVRTLSDLDPQVVDAARAQMREVGGESPAFKGTARMLAAEGMQKLDTAGQKEMLRAVRAHPDDTHYHKQLRLLVAQPAFQKLSPQHRSEVIDAFKSLPEGTRSALLEGMKATKGDQQVHLLETFASPALAALDPAGQKARMNETVAKETAAPAPAPEQGKPGEAKLILEKKWGDHVVRHYQVDGVTFRVSEAPPKVKVDVRELPKMAAAINAANKLIADPARQVRDVAISNVASRLTTYNGRPMLLLSHEDANASVATHESGHAVFDALRFSFKAPPGVDRRVADIYARLADTKVVSAKERKDDGTHKQDRPAGLWIFDPSQWSKTLTSEHPWDDPDEMFASALRAYKTDRAGLERSIERFAKLDPAAAAPAREMLALLDELHAGQVSDQPLDQAADRAAKRSLDQLRRATPLEDTLDSMGNVLLKMAIQPETMPGK